MLVLPDGSDDSSWFFSTVHVLAELGGGRLFCCERRLHLLELFGGLALYLISGLHLITAVCPSSVSPFMSTTCDQSDVPDIGGARDFRTPFCRAVIDMMARRRIWRHGCTHLVIVVIIDLCRGARVVSFALVDHC